MWEDNGDNTKDDRVTLNRRKRDMDMRNAMCAGWLEASRAEGQGHGLRQAAKGSES